MKQRIRKVQSHFRFHILLSLKVKYYSKRITNLFQYWGAYLLLRLQNLMHSQYQKSLGNTMAYLMKITTSNYAGPLEFH